jgi:hypothetical protein
MRDHGRGRLLRRWRLNEPIARVSMAESTESFIEAEAAGHTWARRVNLPADEYVLGHTENWLNALPKGARPVHLQREFPRIANELARLWGDTSELDRYFEEKEFSPRERRHGFSPLIKEELLAMHGYSLRSRPVPYEAQLLRRALHQAAVLGQGKFPR